MHKVVLDCCSIVEIGSDRRTVKPGFRVLIPDLVVAALGLSYGSTLSSVPYEVCGLSATQMAFVDRISQRNAGLYLPDVASLVLAHTTRSVLVASDAMLMRAAEAENVPTRDVLWLSTRTLSSRSTTSAPVLDTESAAGCYVRARKVVRRLEHTDTK